MIRTESVILPYTLPQNVRKKQIFKNLETIQSKQHCANSSIKKV